MFKHGSLAQSKKKRWTPAPRAGAGAGAPGGAAPTTAPAPGPGAAPSHRAGSSRDPPPRRSSSSKYLPNGRARDPTAFGGPTGPLRLLKVDLGGQAGWMLPFALVGLIALALWSIGVGPLRVMAARQAMQDRPQPTTCKIEHGGRSATRSGGRRDPRLARPDRAGRWFLIEAGVLSFSKGIVHPYYVSALGAGDGGDDRRGAVAFVAQGRRRVHAPRADPDRGRRRPSRPSWRCCGDDHYMHWFWPVLIVGAAVGVVALIALRRWTRPAMALTLCLLLLAPGAYAATTWEFAGRGHVPRRRPARRGGGRPARRGPAETCGSPGR